MRAKNAQHSPNPRRQFVEDMIHFIKEKQNEGHKVKLDLDANEVLGAESNGVSKILHECGMWDLLEVPGGNADAQLKDTFMQGNNQRIDHILGTWLFYNA